MDEKAADRLRHCLDGHRTARDIAAPGADLRGVHLPGLRADGLDLGEADLRDSVLARVKWTACRLPDARLEGADLAGAVLRLCGLDAARAANACFAGARIENCTARGARFDRADLANAVLTDTDFSRASLRGAVLENVSASGCDLRGADLREARLRGAVLTDADLRGADLTGADLAGSDLSGSDLAGADLRGATGLGESPADDLPEDLRPLVQTMGPVVAQVLRTADRQAMLDPDTARQLVAQGQRLGGDGPGPAPETLAAVERILPLMGADLLPALAEALRTPGTAGPPAEAQRVILALRKELGLAEGATAEDVLASLRRGMRRGTAPGRH
jgi:uncharacterized protein YjbI with pentapeptide repeats